MPTLILAKYHRVEKERNEIREMIGMEMGKQYVSDGVPIRAGLDQVGQRARAEIQEEQMVGAYQVAGRGARRMDIGTGAQNGDAHHQCVRA
jgi:hypothetical protein